MRVSGADRFVKTNMDEVLPVIDKMDFAADRQITIDDR